MLSLSVLRNARIYSLYKRLGVLLCPSRAVYTLLSNTININSQRPRERTQIQTLQSDLSIIIRNRRQSDDFPAFEHWVFQVYGYCSNQCTSHLFHGKVYFVLTRFEDITIIFTSYFDFICGHCKSCAVATGNGGYG